MPTGAERLRAHKLKKDGEMTEAEKQEALRLERQRKQVARKVWRQSTSEVEKQDALRLERQRKQASRKASEGARSELEKQEALEVERQRKQASRKVTEGARSEQEQEQYLCEDAKRKQKAKIAKAKEADQSRASFSLEAMNPSVHFDNFEDHPEAAVMLYHLNSGHGQFELLNDLIHEAGDNGGEVDGVKLESLLDEIGLEALTPDELEKLVETFLSFQGREFLSKDKGASPNKLTGIGDTLDCHHLICGLCGVRGVHGRYEKYCEVIALKDLPSVIHLNESQRQAFLELQSQPPLVLPLNEQGDLGEFHLSNLKSTYYSEALDTYFHMHPEALLEHNSMESTVLCPTCSDWYKNAKKSSHCGAPENSVASGLDFGNATRIGLDKPTVMENTVLSRYRIYHSVLRIHNNMPVRKGERVDGTKCQIRANCVLFPTNSPKVASASLVSKILASDSGWETASKELKELITFQMVGAEGDHDFLLKSMEMSSILKCRPHVLYQRLCIYQHLHPQYAQDIKLPDATEASFNSFFRSFAVNVEKFTTAALQSATSIADKTALDADRYECDDITQVRSKITTNPVAPSDQCQDEIQHDVEMCYSLLSESPLFGQPEAQEQTKGSTATYLRELADVFGVTLPQPEDNEWKLTRDEVPANEFTTMQDILPGTFPDVFLLGQSYDSKGLPNKRQIRHMLLQFTNCAATNRQLLFYLFDTLSRHDVVYNFATKVKKDPSSWEAFSKLITSDSFREKLRIAATDSKADPDITREVLRIVMPVLSFGTRHSVPGSLTDPSGMSRAFAQHRRYGPGTVLYTLTVDDKNSPNLIRLSRPLTSNTKFPATVDDEFFEALQQGTCYSNEASSIKLPLDYTARHQASTSNPVAVALEFQSMIENVVQILIGCPLDFQGGTGGGQKKTYYFKSNHPNNPHHKGIFGHVTAVCGCIETQARGALHIHVVIYGGLKPKLLEDCVGFDGLCHAVSAILDSMYSAAMPMSSHMEQMLHQKMKHNEEGKQMLPKLSRSYASMHHVPSPVQDPSEWLRLLLMNIYRTGIHSHSFTCRKHAAGRFRCRGAFPCACNQKTGPIELLLPWCSDATDETLQPLSKAIPLQSTHPIQVKSSNLNRNYSINLLPEEDQRLIVWELKRPTQGTLPPLSDEWEHEFQNSWKNNDIDNHTVDLCAAKEFCINALLSALKEEDSPNNFDSSVLHSFASISLWLETQSPCQVIFIYRDLQTQLAGRNGWMVSTNPAAHVLTGSSNNAILLGNVLQGKASFFYVLKYLQKDKVQLQASLISLEQAANHVEQYKSIASDSGSAKRTVQHMFTRAVNDLARSVQISDTQVALCLLNTGTEVTSDSFGYFGALFNQNYLVHHSSGFCDANLEEADIAPIGSGIEDLSSTESTDSGEDCTGGQELQEEEVELEVPDSMLEDIIPVAVSNSKSFGPAPFYKVPDETDPVGKKRALPIHYPTHYWFRGEQLAKMTAFEYAAMVQVVPRKQVLEEEILQAFDQVSQSHPEELQDLTLDVESYHNKPGRPARTQFRFHPLHPLYESHAQVLRSKQNTLIINGFAPKYPGPRPLLCEDSATSNYEIEEHQRALKHWTKLAKKFAQFYIANFMPHDCFFGDSFPDSSTYLSFEALSVRIEHLEKSCRLIDRMRVEAVTTYIRGFRSNSKRDKLLDNFRHRCTTRWTDEERKESDMIHRNMGVTSKFQESMDANTQDDNKVTMEFFGPSKIRNIREDRIFGAQQLKVISDLHEFVSNREEVQHTAQLPVTNSNLPFDYKRKPESIAKSVAAIATATLPDSGRRLSLKRGRDGKFISKKTEGWNYIESRDLSVSQAHVVMKVFDYFSAIDQRRVKETIQHFSQQELLERGIKPPKLLMTGEPGSGKSYTIDTICELASVMKVGVVATTSYNGIAAVNIDGNTIAKMFAIHSTGASGKTSLTNDKVEELRSKMDLDNVCMIIVDEVSTIDTKHIAFLDLRLQQLLSNNSPFGGMPIMFSGDFNQLGPVLKDFIPTSMMLFAKRNKKTSTPNKKKNQSRCHSSGVQMAAVNTSFTYSEAAEVAFQSKQERIAQDKEDKKVNNFRPSDFSYKGADLFSKFRRFHLKEQKRSVTDTLHCNLVSKFDKGEKIQPQDLQIYAHLSEEDLASDPDWLFAPVLVATNEERLNITRQKCSLWAKLHKTYVFKWKTKVIKTKNPASPTLMPSIENHNAFFWQYFVEGATGFLTETINGELALVNGAPISMHSLTFSSKQEHDTIKARILQGDFNYGDEIVIDTPACVSVEVSQSLDGKPVSKRRQSQLQVLQKLSNHRKKIIIPLVKNSGNRKPKTYNFYNQSIIQPYSEVEVQDPFSFQLGFSMTVHKAQGRTIDKVVLDLHYKSNHLKRLKFDGIFVALSRVRTRASIRLIRHTHTSFEEAYSYISRLKPADNVIAFYRGFTGSPKEGQVWDMQLALGFPN